MKEVDFQGALEALRRGKILIYPTETLYGLGVDISQAEAVERLFHEKQREANKAISVLVGSLEQLQGLVSNRDPKLLNLINKFLPGPLTLIVPAAAGLNPRLHGGSGWVGLRLSSHPMAQSLAATFGPITTTSANPSGQTPALSEAQVRSYFAERDDVAFLSGGDLPPSKGSTVVKVLSKGLELIREGDIPFSEIESEFESR